MINISHLAVIYEASRNMRIERARNEAEALVAAVNFVMTANDALAELGIVSHQLTTSSGGAICMARPQYGAIASMSIKPVEGGNWRLRSDSDDALSRNLDELGGRFMELVVKDAATMTQW